MLDGVEMTEGRVCFQLSLHGVEMTEGRARFQLSLHGVEMTEGRVCFQLSLHGVEMTEGRARFQLSLHGVEMTVGRARFHLGFDRREPRFKRLDRSLPLKPPEISQELRVTFLERTFKRFDGGASGKMTRCKPAIKNLAGGTVHRSLFTEDEIGHRMKRVRVFEPRAPSGGHHRLGTSGIGSALVLWPFIAAAIFDAARSATARRGSAARCA